MKNRGVSSNRKTAGNTRYDHENMMNWRVRLSGTLTALIWVLPALAAAKDAVAPVKPDLAFGIIADIQYSDEDSRGARRYRESLGKLRKCVADWNEQDIDFAVNLGDIIDGNETPEATARDFSEILGEFADLRAESYHVLGNHCLSVGRKNLLRDLILPASYYDFVREGWRFIVLDSTDISTYGWAEGHANHSAAKALLEKYGTLPAYRPWGGALGPGQLAWLASSLEQASQRGERVMVFSHMPLLVEASGPEGVLWNAAEVAKLLEKSGRVAVFFGGHHHSGGYFLKNGVHHVTIEGMIEAPTDGNAYAVVRVYKSKLVIDGTGSVPDRVLKLRK